MDLQDYQASPQALDHLKDVDFVAVVGPTAVGKTTLIKAAVASDPRMHMLVAGTSRLPRPGEKDGVDFHYGTPQAMQARAEKGGYVTLILGVSGDFYTTAPEDYPPGKIILLATLSSAVNGFRKLPYKNFRTIFILPPSYEIWQQRLHQHDFDEQQLQRRLQEAATSLEFGLQDSATQFVTNDELAAATKDFLQLAQGHPATESQATARELATKLLEKVRLKTTK
jgi:guanylate kinase